MRTFLTIIVALVCAATFAQKKPSINKAKSALDNGELSEAKVIIDQAIDHEKTMDNARTWYYRGMIYANLDTISKEPGAMEIAVKSFGKALELDPEQSQVSNFTGTGIENVDTHIDKYHGYYYNQAAKMYGSEEYATSSALFEKAYYIMPSDTGSLVNAALTATLDKNDERATELYIRALDQGVKDINVFLRLYNTALTNEKFEDALSYIRKGKEAHPNNINLSKYEINLLIQLDRIVEAQKEIEITIAEDPSNPDLHFSLGVLKEGKEDLEGALESYKNALAVDPNHYNSNFNLGVMKFSVTNDLIKQRNALGYKEEKKYNQLTEKINTQLKDSLPIWEKIYSLNSKDEAVLETLKYIYVNLKMNDKAEKIADELDALKG
jgi:Tfp pilus assembly protein PilF